MPDTTIDEGFLEERLEAMWRGVVEGVRREVDRLRELNLPIYVAENGNVVDLNAARSSRPGADERTAGGCD